MRCAVFGCNSDNQSKKNPCSPDIKFFTFPQNEQQMKLWVHATGRKDNFSAKNSRVCSKHFLDTDYKVNLKYELLNCPAPKRHRGLKEDAVPTQDLPHLSSKATSSCATKRSAGIKKKERKQIVEKLLSTENIASGNNEELNNNGGGMSIGDGINSGVDDVAYETHREDIVVTLQTRASTPDTNKGVQTDMTILEIDSLKSQLDNAMKTTKELEETQSAMEKIFSKNQIAKLKNNNRRMQWSVSEISNAIVLYSAGPRAYRLMLKKGHPYPALSTLRAWLKKIKIRPGILRNVFKLVESSDFNKRDKVCSLLFDEMKIKKEYVYDRSEDEVLRPFSYAQVVMMSGLFKSWKQPIFYDYDTKMTSDTFLNVIKFVESSGFQVVAVISDLGGGNRGLHNEMGITHLKPYFTNPQNGEKIYVFADVPHLLKLIRNNFVDHGFIVDGKEINKSVVEAVLDATTAAASDLKITHKITKDQLNVTGAQRQKVKFAAKLFSHTMSKSISRCGTLGYLPEYVNWAECSDFFKLVNDWFDIFNVSIPVSDARTRNRAYGLAIQEQNQILDQMSEMMLNMRVKGRNYLLPFQKGILMSNLSLKLLLEDLQRRFGIEFILTRHLNQDLLELFFGIIRAKGGLHDHPNALEFKHRLRAYIMGRNDGAYSEFANVETDDTPDLPITGQLIQRLNPKNAPLESCSEGRTLPVDNEADELHQELHELAYDGLENLAGFICYKLKDPSIQRSGASSTYTWVDHLNEGGLSIPSDAFLAEVEHLEMIFLSVNGDSLLATNHYIENLMTKSLHVNCSDKAKKLFFRSRMYFRMKELNRSLNTLTLGKRKLIKIAT